MPRWQTSDMSAEDFRGRIEYLHDVLPTETDDPIQWAAELMCVRPTSVRRWLREENSIPAYAERVIECKGEVADLRAKVAASRKAPIEAEIDAGIAKRARMLRAFEEEFKVRARQMYAQIEELRMELRRMAGPMAADREKRTETEDEAKAMAR